MKHNIFLISCLTLLLSGCASDYLDIKPNQALVVPSELSHYQAIIDAFANGMNDAPGLPVIAADEFYLLENEIQNASTMERNTYLWNKDIFEGAQSTDWNVPYRCIFYANVAIDGLEKLSQREKQTEQWRQAYGGALFFRAHALFNLSQMFAAGYNVATANNLPGLPIRKTMNINEIVGRGTLQQTYDQILDLNNAEKLLSTVMDFENRPSKAAASALLARIYLVMGSYDKAKESATASLGIYQKLLNYNTLNPAAVRPFPITLTKGNPEVMFVVRLQGYTAVMNSTTAGVDSILYKSYHQNDLRKSCYFTLINGQYRYKGSYQGSSTFFGGLSTSEQYLILAECHARQGETELALHNLNTLLRQRFVTGTFQELTADNNTILPLVLLERRKELFARGLRWSDLKRLNQNPATAVTLTKRFGAQQYTLAPNDKRYAFPIPDGEIELSGIDQNPR